MKTISAEEFDKKFDNGEDISEYVDWSKTFTPEEEMKRVNIDYPMWMVKELDRHAKHIGVTRQSLIKMWIAQRLKIE